MDQYRVKTETLIQRTLSAIGPYEFREGNSYGPIIGPYLFLDKFVWTNGPESSSKVSHYTLIGPWMALPPPSEPPPHGTDPSDLLPLSP